VSVRVKQSTNGAATTAPKSHKLSLNVSPDTGARLRRLAFEQRLSESSIVEAALCMLFQRGDDEQLGTLLRTLGASLRRK